MRIAIEFVRTFPSLTISAVAVMIALPYILEIIDVVLRIAAR